MAQILVRNLDEDCVERLKKRAMENGRSLQAEAKLILEQTARVDVTTARALADRLRAAAGPQQSDSAEILRDLRDA